MTALLLLAVILSSGFDCGFAAVNPGLMFQLSQTGLNYGADVAVEILTSKVRTLRIPDQRGSARTKLGKVNYEITNMKVISFDKPYSAVNINPSAGLTWRLMHVRLAIRGNWRYRFHFVRDSGTFDMAIVARTFLNVGVSLGKDPNGRFTISSRTCSCMVDSVKIRFHGGASWLYNLFSSKVERPVRDILRRRVCDEANKVINVNARAQLATLPVTIDILKYWMLDYRLVLPPVFQTRFVESYHKGEFFLKNSTREAPFQASPFPSTVGDRMVTIWVSDYVLSTIGYVLYNGGVLKRHLTKEDLPREEEGLLNTTCTSYKCFGNLVPSAGNMYPNATAEFEVVATSSPTATVTAAGVQGNVAGTVACSARLSNGSLVPMFKANMTVVLDLQVSLNKMVLRGNITRLSSVINVTESKIGELSSEVLTLLFNMATKAVILPELNAVGQKGIPVPGFKNVQFVNTRLDNLNRCVRIATDVRYVRSTYLRYDSN